MMKDVVAVNMKTKRVRVLAQSKTPENADAIIRMAVFRRGVDVEFYADPPAGQYKEGDEWKG